MNFGMACPAFRRASRIFSRSIVFIPSASMGTGMKFSVKARKAPRAPG